jgi:rhamnosyltransferase
LIAIRSQVERMVIVDNGSPAGTQSMLGAWGAANNAELISNAENWGLAAALNQGMAWSEEDGCEWAVTFDQDSTPRPGLVAALLGTAQSAGASDRVAMVGAHTVDERTGREDRWVRPAWWGFRRVQCVGGDLHGVTFVITSGTLTRVRAWRSLGGFDEGLFIDYLDHDLCLKAHRAGWEILVSAGARLAHRLGSKREIVMAIGCMHPTFHGPIRHYYMARNRVLMWRRHAGRFPHWALFDATFWTLNIVRVLLTEDRRREKMAAMLLGIWHGLLGRRGPIKSTMNRTSVSRELQRTGKLDH